MKSHVCIIFALALSACASAPESFDRNNQAWVKTIIGCESAAELAGTNSEKAVWSYEKSALLADRNGGWKSDIPRINNSVKKNKQQLLAAGSETISQKLAQCHQVVSAYFPAGHPAVKDIAL